MVSFCQASPTETLDVPPGLTVYYYYYYYYYHLYAGYLQMYLKQTMFLGYVALQLFCIYSLCYM